MSWKNPVMRDLAKAQLREHPSGNIGHEMGVALKVVKTKAEEEFAEHFAALGAALPGNDNVSAMRKDAIVRFEHLGLPHRRVEEWKYTDLRGRFDGAFQPASGDVSAVSVGELDTALEGLAGLECARLVFVNGAYAPTLSNADGVGAGVEIMSLTQAFADPPSWFAEVLDKANPPQTDEAVVALNTAFMSDGAVINISGDVDKPIHLVFVSAGDTPQAVTARNIISVGKQAKVTFVESYVSVGNAATQTNVVSEMIVGDEAQVDHIQILTGKAEGTHLSTWMTRLGADVTYRAFQFTNGCALSRNQQFVKLAGENTKLNISGVVMLQGKQHSDTTLVVDHSVPHCESRELFKAVLYDETRGVFQGKVIVQRHAQKTDGEQMSHALLLSETAEFDSKPELEIFADDVVCGHGATSGQIDEELLFYLRARGLPENIARAMLITAFVGEAFEAVQNEAVRDILTDIAANWLAARGK